MKKIAIIGLSNKTEIWDFIKNIEKYQTIYNFQIEKFIYNNKDFHLYDRLSDEIPDYENYLAAISVGGDGTFLYASRIFAGTGIPLFGVNIGQLGFNTNIELHDFEKYFNAFFKDEIVFEEKNLIDIQIKGKKEIYTVLNDGVISYAGISRMIKLKVELAGEPICEFRGDGLIVSSPTGSTAYNLSAGGPILHPLAEVFSITPICPHILAIRPIIVPFNISINIKVEESSALPQLTLDGQKSIILEVGQRIVFNKSDKKIKVVKTARSFSEILKEKLGWMV